MRKPTLFLEYQVSRSLIRKNPNTAIPRQVGIATSISSTTNDSSYGGGAANVPGKKIIVMCKIF